MFPTEQVIYGSWIWPCKKTWMNASGNRLKLNNDKTEARDLWCLILGIWTAKISQSETLVKDSVLSQKCDCVSSQRVTDNYSISSSKLKSPIVHLLTGKRDVVFQYMIGCCLSIHDRMLYINTRQDVGYQYITGSIADDLVEVLWFFSPLSLFPPIS